MDSNASPGGIKTPRNATLERTTFTVSRLMEYFSVPELTKQNLA